MADSEPPSASSNIDISTSAVVKWGTSHILSDVIFDARRPESTNDAFFKLRSTVTLKAWAPTKTPLFIFIHPERIHSLQYDTPHADEAGPTPPREESARKTLGNDTVCLRFILTQPADLVGPKTSDWAPKNKTSDDILDSLRDLARHDSFAVYFPRNLLSQARLAALCEAASTSGLLKSIADQANLGRLYRGKGGQVLNEPAPVDDDASTASWNSPPSYGDVDPAPPLDVAEAGPSKKRRLSESDDVASGRIDRLDVERLCRKIVDEQQSKLYDRLLAELKPYIGREMQQLEHRILDHIQEHSGRLAQEQDDELEKRLEEVNDTIEARVSEVDENVEGEFYGLRLRLEEYIHEEMAGAEERMVENLQQEMAEAEDRMVENLQSSASVSIQFN